MIDRRQAAVLAVTVLAATALASGITAAQDRADEYAVEQGATCIDAEALSFGDRTVDEFYNYTANESGAGTVFSANTPIGIESVNEGTSSLFLYEGPDGHSLVVLHGAVDDAEGGGAATFQFEGLPATGEWVVRDDPENESVERWNRTGTTDWRVDWGWQFRYTDGGAYQGLGDDFEVRIDPAFNEDAGLDPVSPGNVTEWRVLTPRGETLRSISLGMNESVTVRSGSCE